MRINLMENSSTFALTEVNATTVGALRQERDLGDAVINVDRVVAADDHVLEERADGEEMNVAVVNKDKKGGRAGTAAFLGQGGNQRYTVVTGHIIPIKGHAHSAVQEGVCARWDVANDVLGVHVWIVSLTHTCHNTWYE